MNLQGGAVYAVSGEDTLLGGISSFEGNTAVSPRTGDEHLTGIGIRYILF